MARKRPIEDAPPGVSSSEEEETGDEEEEETSDGTAPAHRNVTGKKQKDDENGSEDEGSDEEEDDDDGGETEKPNLPPSEPSKSESESDTETNSEDTASTQPASPSVSDFTIKPISPKRKPVPKLEQPKKENDVDDMKAKRGAGAGASQRLWSDEDEIVILNGMVEYQTEKGKNPFADAGDFHGFVKKSLHVDATNNQFVDKIRRLKKKYFTDVDKNENEIDEIFSKPHDLECVELAKKIWGVGCIEVGKKGNSIKKSRENVGGGGGEGRGITLALAKKWSEEANGENRKVSVKKGKRGSIEEVNGEGKEGNLKKRRQILNEEVDGGEKGKRGLGEGINGEGKGKSGKKEKRAVDEELSGKGEEVNVIVKKQRRLVNDEMNRGRRELSVKKRNAVANEELDGEEAETEDLWDKYPYLRSSLDGENLPEDVKERTMLMLGMAGEEKLVELEREWRNLMKVKLEFIVKQKDLIAKQIKLSLDAMNSQDS